MDEDDSKMFQGIGNSAQKSKTLSEMPVSDKDIEENEKRLAALREDLTELKAEGEEVF